MPADETTTAQQFVIDADREHVIAATTAATAELGYPELTIAAIADRAGGPSSAVLAHFPDVDACFLAAYDAAIARLVTSVWTAFEAQHGWVQQVRAGLHALLEHCAENPVEAHLLMVDALAATVALERRHAALQGFTVFIRPAAGEAPRGLELSDAVVEHVVGGIYEIIFSRVYQGLTAELPGLLPDLLYCATVPYLGPRRASIAARKARREECPEPPRPRPACRGQLRA